MSASAETKRAPFESADEALQAFADLLGHDVEVVAGGTGGEVETWEPRGGDPVVQPSDKEGARATRGYVDDIIRGPEADAAPGAPSA